MSAEMASTRHLFKCCTCQCSSLTPGQLGVAFSSRTSSINLDLLKGSHCLLLFTSSSLLHGVHLNSSNITWCHGSAGLGASVLQNVDTDIGHSLGAAVSLWTPKTVRL